MKKRRAMTVAEGLVSLTLAVLILSMIGTLLSRILAASQRANEGDRLNQGNLVTLSRMATECRACTAWHSPQRNQAAPVDVLDLETPDLAQDAARLPLPPPNPVGTAWNPRKPTFQCRIVYLRDQANLLRKVTIRGNTSTTVVASGVTGLAFERVSREEIKLSLDVEDSVRGQRHSELITRLPLINGWRLP